MLTAVDSFVCSSRNCGYNVYVDTNDLTLLYELVSLAGGLIDEFNQVCPRCGCNSLVYGNETY